MSEKQQAKITEFENKLEDLKNRRTDQLEKLVKMVYDVSSYYWRSGFAQLEIPLRHSFSNYECIKISI